MIKKAYSNSISFVPFGTELLLWAIEKDRRFHSADKLKQGIVSYTSALHELGFYFKKIATGESRQNAQPVSAWARAWGWDYRKTLRFITIVIRDLFALNYALKKAKALRERIEEDFKKQQEKVRNYMRKFRGSTVSMSRAETNNLDDETEDERLFLDAMAALAKINPAYYRSKIKEKLKAGDEVTITNFQNWVQKNRKKGISQSEVAQAIATRVINGHRIISYSIMHNGKYMVEFDDGFRTPMTAEAIVG